MVRVACLLLAMAVPVGSSAEAIPGVDNAARARVNYMLNCQGCHGPTGAGTVDGSVPQMRDFVSRFLWVEGGRNFLVQVPGSANAALSDDALAEVLNWMLVEIDPMHIPTDFQPYTGSEVGQLRKSPLEDITGERARLIASMPQKH